MEMNWIDGFAIEVKIVDGAVMINANREGLLSLANHLTELAGTYAGNHFHLDEHNSLEEGSAELIVAMAE